jgi:hypothetical protein
MSDVTQSVFYGGEIAETVASRTDIPKRSQSLKTMRNVFPHKHGAASNRGGTEHMAPASVFSGNVRRIPFVYNNDDTYTIEITDQKFRFMRNGGFVLEGLGLVVSGVDYGTDVITCSAVHGLSIGDYVYFKDNTGAGHYKFVDSVPTTSTATLKNHDGTSFDLIDNSGALTETLDRIYTLTSDYVGADIPLLKYQQKADTMKITHRNYYPQNLTRSGHAAWTISRPDFEPSLDRPTSVVAYPSSRNDNYFYQFNNEFDQRMKIKSISAANPAIINFEVVDHAGASISGAEHNLYENRVVIVSGGTFTGADAATAEDILNPVRCRLQAVNDISSGTDTLIEAELHFVNGGNISTNGLTFTLTDDTMFFGDKSVRYKISAVDKDGRESFPSESTGIQASDAVDYERPVSLAWVAPTTYTVEEFYIYKEENEVYGFIGTAVRSEEGISLYFNDYNLAPELADNPQEEPMRVPFYTNIEEDGISHADPISIHSIQHRRKAGDRVMIESDAGGFTNGAYYVKAVADDDNFTIEDVDGNTIDGTGDTISITGVDLLNPCVISMASHSFVEGEIVEINGIVGTTQLNGRQFTIGAVTATTVELVGEDALLYTAWISGGTIDGYHTDGFEADYPACVTFFRQRVGYGSMFNARQTVEYSATGQENTFSQSSDAFSNPMDEAQANELRHLLSGADLLNFTSGSVILSSSGDSGFSASTVDNVEQMAAGIDDRVEPLKMRNSLIYVQDKYSQVFDLAYTFEQNKYLGQDLTILAPHLIDEARIISWAYQRVPEPIVWCVLDTGDIIGIIYERDNEIFGWHIHDTEGTFLDVCVQPEGSEERVHLVVERTINSETVIYHERLWGRSFTKLQDCKFLDSCISLDDPVDITAITEEASSDAIKITASGHGLSDDDQLEVDDTLGSTELNEMKYRAAEVDGADFYVVSEDASDKMNIVKILGSFGSTDIELWHDGIIEVNDGDAIFIEGTTITDGVASIDSKWYLASYEVGDGGNTVRLSDFAGTRYNRTGWTGLDWYQTTPATGTIKVATVIDKDDVSAYTSSGYIRRALSTVYGLSHLEGETVIALCDGNVVRENDGADLVVANGCLTFEEAHARIHVGIEYVPLMETLELDTQQSELNGIIRSVERVNLKVNKTTGLKAGPSVDMLNKMRDPTEGTLGDNPALYTGEVSVDFEPLESNRGSVVLRMDDPLPFTIQAIGMDVSTGDRK